MQDLIDTGSTHNLVDEEVAKKLGCKFSSITEQSVSEADRRIVQTATICRNLYWLLQGTTFSFDFLVLLLGNVDIVLGVGRILFDFQNRTIEFVYEGKKHVLRGVTTQLKATKDKH